MAHLPRTMIDLIKTDFAPGSLGMLLTGSFARGEASAQSDIDLLKFVSEVPADPQKRYVLYVRQGYLISVTTTSVEEKEAEMQKAETAIWCVPGLRQSQVLYDPWSYLHHLRKKAFSFEWEPSLQKEANQYASSQILGYAEEAHKVVSALLRKDESAMMYGVSALYLAMPRILAVQQGLMIRSENSLFSQVQEAVGDESDWTKYLRLAMGVEQIETTDWVAERGRAGLRLYRETVSYLKNIIPEHQMPVIQNALNVIKNYFGDQK
ncbi:MAG: hypothetical protein CL609_08310 [Anaerolineaceae bacterium]|nr:hypothetical protein [Anaerolineaceae bacterium]